MRPIPSYPAYIVIQDPLQITERARILVSARSPVASPEAQTFLSLSYSTENPLKPTPAVLIHLAARILNILAA